MASFPWQNAEPVDKPRKAPSGTGGAAWVLTLLPENQEGTSPAPEASLEVDLGRGEQGED